MLKFLSLICLFGWECTILFLVYFFLLQYWLFMIGALLSSDRLSQHYLLHDFVKG